MYSTMYMYIHDGMYSVHVHLKVNRMMKSFLLVTNHSNVVFWKYTASSFYEFHLPSLHIVAVFSEVVFLLLNALIERLVTFSQLCLHSSTVKVWNATVQTITLTCNIYF